MPDAHPNQTRHTDRSLPPGNTPLVSMYPLRFDPIPETPRRPGATQPRTDSMSGGK